MGQMKTCTTVISKDLLVLGPRGQIQTLGGVLFKSGAVFKPIRYVHMRNMPARFLTDFASKIFVVYQRKQVECDFIAIVVTRPSVRALFCSSKDLLPLKCIGLNIS